MPIRVPQARSRRLFRLRRKIQLLRAALAPVSGGAPTAPALPAPMLTLHCPEDALGDLLQVHFVLQSLSDVLQMPSGEEGSSLASSIDLYKLDGAIADGDSPLVHRIHSAMVNFLVRASLEPRDSDVLSPATILLPPITLSSSLYQNRSRISYTTLAKVRGLA